MLKPQLKPNRPYFSSGPTAKRPGWTPQALQGALLGYSHRSVPGLARINELLSLMKEILEIPQEYEIAIMPASTTGAMECAFWSLLGERPVDVFSCDVFGDGWVYDIVSQLKIPEIHPTSGIYQAPFVGALPDFHKVNPQHDVVFVANGTTSGAQIKDFSWLSADASPERLVLCDATSLVFTSSLPWHLLDVVGFSWQKGLGGEAGFGILVLSPRAFKRLESYRPPWPLPRLFRLTHNNNLLRGIFQGETINTPSLLCIEDCLDALKWAQQIGSLPGLCTRVQANFEMIASWVEKTPWVDFLAADPASISHASVCLKIVDPLLQSDSTEEQWAFIYKLTNLLREEGVAFDINNHKFSVPSLRIWAGPTIDAEDIQRLLPWLEWAFQESVIQKNKIAG